MKTTTKTVKKQKFTRKMREESVGAILNISFPLKTLSVIH